MNETISQIFYPSNLQEFFSAANRFGTANLFSYDIYKMLDQRGKTVDLPKVIIDANQITELHNINRTERYIEIGSMVNLNQIFKLGKILPDVMRQSLDVLYGRFLRNLISIGSIVCQTSEPEPLAAALIALDVRCELRTNVQSRWISALRLTGPDKLNIFFPQEILYRVRIPLEQWDFTLCKYFYSTDSDKTENGFIVFLARIQNDILSDVRVVFSGSFILRDRNCEASLIGQKLPLAKKEAAAFTHLWKNNLNESIPPFLRYRILSFIENAILQFAD
ncbi:MAG: FAD binding domain-containing protein [Treponema sp.]|jgi:CO/xanthine dehydrogenase FAD-binding subunit|nr:FAD binding domain-containing protein [Treponema sp.]